MAAFAGFGSDAKTALVVANIALIVLVAAQALSGSHGLITDKQFSADNTLRTNLASANPNVFEIGFNDFNYLFLDGLSPFFDRDYAAEQAAKVNADTVTRSAGLNSSNDTSFFGNVSSWAGNTVNAVSGGVAGAAGSVYGFLTGVWDVVSTFFGIVRAALGIFLALFDLFYVMKFVLAARETFSQ